MVPSLYKFKGGVESKDSCRWGDLSQDFQNKQHLESGEGREFFADKVAVLRKVQRQYQAGHVGGSPIWRDRGDTSSGCWLSCAVGARAECTTAFLPARVKKWVQRR